MAYDSVQTFIKYLEGIHARTARLIPLIPADKLEHTPGERNFSFGDTIRHLAGMERYMFIAIAVGEANTYPGHQENLASGVEAARAYYDNLHQESIDMLAGLNDKDLQKKCQTPAGASITTWKWLRAMIEHEIHHRGQLYLMLSLIGVTTPPIFGLTSEEVLEAAS